MIRIHRLPLARHQPAPHRLTLTRKQAAANGLGPGDVQIERAWKNFRRTMCGRAVYQALQAAFRFKCVFCERVNARTADHFYPKERYPRRMFRWTNLLLCCGECNPAKGDYFPFVDRHPVLIDPTREDPLDFFTWDLQTGSMVPSTDPARGQRARVTRDRLRLEEGPLRDERRVQLNRVLHLLADVVNEHPAIRPETLQRLEEELHADRQFLGIIRFLFREPNRYSPLVNEARVKLPDIDRWTAAWL